MGHHWRTCSTVLKYGAPLEDRLHCSEVWGTTGGNALLLAGPEVWGTIGGHALLFAGPEVWGTTGEQVPLFAGPEVWGTTGGQTLLS